MINVSCVRFIRHKKVFLPLHNRSSLLTEVILTGKSLDIDACSTSTKARSANHKNLSDIIKVIQEIKEKKEKRPCHLASPKYMLKWEYRSLYGCVILLNFIAFENHLTDLLGVKVDLVMQDALKPYIGQHILHEVIDV